MWLPTTLPTPQPSVYPTCVEDVGFKFKSGDIGLRNINFKEEHGKLIGIMGASGAGKTTLLNVLAGIEVAQQREPVRLMA
jgi:ABC-type sugar transport system ATPase subunit